MFLDKYISNCVPNNVLCFNCCVYTGVCRKIVETLTRLTLPGFLNKPLQNFWYDILMCIYEINFKLIKYTVMARYGKRGPGALILAGLAAFAYYKYNKMNSQQKKDLVDGLKEKGRKIFGSIIPGGKSETAGTTANGYSFSEGH